MGRLFGTDGVRGIANKELTTELAFQLGRAGAYILGKNKKKVRIVIGKDTRISGDMLEAALTAGICSLGADVLKVGVLPTPGIAYLTRTLRADAGIVISASHNPAQDNGIKFFSRTGYKLPDHLEDEIEAALNGIEDIDLPAGGDVGRVIEVEYPRGRYGEYLKTTAVSLEGLKVVIDCANGAASEVAPRVMTELGAELVPIYHYPNGVNINVNCGSTHPEALIQAVLENKADIGLAFDGDADRVIAVDEKGNIVDGDCIMVICALYLKAKGQLKEDSVTVTVMSNMGLHKVLREAGIKVYETKVGDRYVMEKLLETGTVLGGEQSGHIIFRNLNTTGDGILSALQLLRVMNEQQKSLSVLATQMKRYPQVLVNTKVHNKEKVLNHAGLAGKISEIESILGDDGRILVRPSGTEPLIRVMMEGSDSEKLEKLAGEVIDVISKIDCKEKQS
ncbi:phosphoglucosamine mutase [Syntrophobotulus glycolicus DSM 8271]|uniref:Phosphoglucosamine mutase n=1 Tax=Syntrophobotulus glycolicus (strain DSM 8271 / FlGlyR) TaxID=645991 RepID=F0SYQ0_SYNGF|nr:phosphoglucosamine mutase [Syntrophobotulus glycolicus]ADY54851.1 phosphoglucosamine mutase [Syntrophobotulus glycolicus DSM 8271]